MAEDAGMNAPAQAAPDPRQEGLGLDNPNEARVPITDPRLRSAIGVLYGLRTALETLRNAKWAHELAGMKIAMTLLEADVADAQLDVSRKVLRVCAQAGVDLSRLQMQTFQETDLVICKPWTDKPLPNLSGR